jgi:hypothetical protein
VSWWGWLLVGVGIGLVPLVAVLVHGIRLLSGMFRSF